MNDVSIKMAKGLFLGPFKVRYVVFLKASMQSMFVLLVVFLK